jgi:ribosomal protein L11 methyltransferase
MNESFGSRGGGESAVSAVFQTIDRSCRRLTPGRLESIVGQDLGIAPRQVRAAIRTLIHRGLIRYTYTFGCSFLERSFLGATAVSRHITLIPPDIEIPAGAEGQFVRILPGAAFGGGDHPSTRLALRGLDHVFTCRALTHPARVLDIGTGSGILALAAVQLGAASALGIDVDACSRFEAEENVRLNRLGGRIEISGEPLSAVRGRFGLITANLRLPTLLRLRTELLAHCRDRTVLIFSGLRVEEWPGLVRRYRKDEFTPLWEAAEKGWCCGALCRGGSPVKVS